MRNCFFSIVIVAITATIFSCNPVVQKFDLSKTDTIVYTKFDYSPQGRTYSITAQKDSLQLLVWNSGMDTLLSKSWPFSQDRFNALLKDLKNIKRKGARITEPEMAERSRGEEIQLKNGEERLFQGLDYGDIKDFEGADIAISSLIPNVQDFVDQTRNKAAE